MKPSDWKRFAEHLQRLWPALVAVLSLEVTLVPLGLAVPYLGKRVLDEGYGNRDPHQFLLLAAVSAAVFIVAALLRVIADMLAGRITTRVTLAMMKDVLDHLLSLPMRYFDDGSSGDHVYKIRGDVSAVAAFICGRVPAVLPLTARAVVTWTLVYCLDSTLALLATAIVPVLAIHSYALRRWTLQVSLALTERHQAISRFLHEVLGNILLVKALNSADRESRRFEAELCGLCDAKLRSLTLTGVAQFSTSVLSKVLGGLMLLYGGYRVIEGTLTLGTCAAIMAYLTQLTGMAAAATTFYRDSLIAAVSRDRLNAIFRLAPAVKDPPSASDVELEGGVAFRAVSFAYRVGHPVVQGLSFTLEPGSRVALVGASGCGKTTVLSLLLRLYEPDQGAVLLDGVDQRLLGRSSVTPKIRAALQQPLLWNDTVANNLRYGASEATERDLLWAAELASARGFIDELPQGFNTVIGESGARLSEGQRQRIAIARAVIGRPAVLILDEATSSLDSETEVSILANLTASLAGTTILLVSHRLSAVRAMTSVLYLQSPDCLHASSHDRLAAWQPYRDLFAGQLDINRAV